MANHCSYVTCEKCGEEYCIRCESHRCDVSLSVFVDGEEISSDEESLRVAREIIAKSMLRSDGQ